ncbi:uncharacterized protein PGTG_17990 [Puccinia graminis f. sp. tritici CRL 75-36-700-3]|uniref:Uncharacterized protein n=1 Tax=Puccinia graminis f. sp. tritici (strain CRL 75-36-700-3 / race SCCL) TaxID=418459 RepID=E3L6Z1_PUCGT|nr:uncharacterized protein PGTG_17990 [Puccinia graminis f. sp. tritici CRL 75-36-700-3]EFP92316.2 hypothetical protein PGTG_17990 [Puccinia graminis f. sp. tritici CRL 75-36-700-3]
MALGELSTFQSSDGMDAQNSDIWPLNVLASKRVSVRLSSSMTMFAGSEVLCPPIEFCSGHDPDSSYLSLEGFEEVEAPSSSAFGIRKPVHGLFRASVANRDPCKTTCQSTTGNGLLFKICSFLEAGGQGWQNARTKLSAWAARRPGGGLPCLADLLARCH